MLNRREFRLTGRRYSCIIVAALLVMAAIVLLWQDGADEPEVRGDPRLRYANEMVTVDGVSYRRRQDVTTILLMGIDTEASSASAAGARSGGQADFLRLVVIDDAQKTITQVPIDRDTMMPIAVLDVLGERSGVRTAQICLAHGFGDGHAQSCELTVEAVSNWLYGIPIDYYIAMNLDGIAALNDLLGGVTVMLMEDFSALDASMTAGTTLTLTGEQAEIYVRSRRNIGIGTNEARMARQEQYLSQLADCLSAHMQADEDFLAVLYDGLAPYLTTNISRGRLLNEAWAAREYQLAPVVKLSGTHAVGVDGFVQFYADDAALKQIVVELFLAR